MLEHFSINNSFHEGFKYYKFCGNIQLHSVALVEFCWVFDWLLNISEAFSNFGIHHEINLSTEMFNYEDILKFVSVFLIFALGIYQKGCS